MNILDTILGGQADADLAAIRDAVKQREAILAQRALSDIKAGDTVAFSDLIRPKYLAGMTATVTRVNPKSMVVDCPVDAAYGRFSGAKSVRCPKSLIAGKV